MAGEEPQVVAVVSTRGHRNAKTQAGNALRASGISLWSPPLRVRVAQTVEAGVTCEATPKDFAAIWAGPRIMPPEEELQKAREDLRIVTMLWRRGGQATWCTDALTLECGGE